MNNRGFVVTLSVIVLLGIASLFGVSLFAFREFLVTYKYLFIFAGIPLAIVSIIIIARRLFKKK